MIEVTSLIFVSVLIGLSLSILGSGGSILTVPALIYIVGQDEKMAIASSLAIVGLIALTGAFKYQKSKMIHWSIVLWFGIPSMFASYMAAGLSIYIPAMLQMIVFSVIMLLAAFFMLSKNSNVKNTNVKNSSSIKLVTNGLLVGSVTGIVGVGGGFLIVPSLVAFGRLKITHAIATSLVIIIFQSFTAFYKYYSIFLLQNKTLDWQIILMVAAIGSLGAIFGQKIATNIPQQKLKFIFGIFLLIMGVFIFIQSSRQLL